MSSQLNYLIAKQRQSELESRAERARVARDAADTLLLPNSRRLTRRQVRPADRDGLAALFGRLSPESRHHRFLGSKPRLTASELSFLTDIDHLHHEAIVAIDQGDGSIVGVSRYVGHTDGTGSAELAGEVADELQSMGVGTWLATRIVQCARANGYTRLTATTLWENRAARALLRRLGFRSRASHGTEVEHELCL